MRPMENKCVEEEEERLIARCKPRQRTMRPHPKIRGNS
jgi:hypothetical protein